MARPVGPSPCRGGAAWRAIIVRISLTPEGVMRVLRILAGTFALLTVRGAPEAEAQSLRDQIADLFIFGPGNAPLFLGGSGDPNNPEALRAHGSHYIPAASAANATVISFLINSISGNVSNVPISGTSGGATFRFEGGMPVRTSESPGPIFAERAQTIGRGRLVLGAHVSGMHFSTLRGADLDNLHLTFTHANVDFAGCDSTFGGDCSLMGVPALENDVIELDLALDMSIRVATLFLTYGVTDRIDFGVVVPIVSTSLQGASQAQVFPFGGTTATHYFGGTATNPQLSATRLVQGQARGLGDVAVRVKGNLRPTGPALFSLLADARFATGSEDDLLGSGTFAVRGLGIFSAQFGDFSPHFNVGYLYRHSEAQNDALLGTIGFDQVLAPWATLAIDLVSELQVGDGGLRVPDEVVIDVPFRRLIRPALIPNTRDDIVNGSLGAKFTAAPGLTIVANSLWPLNRGGLRANVVWTVGLEYSF